MASPKENLLYGLGLSSVGPARVTGPSVVYEPSNMDLAMKLHYLRGVYYFRSEAVQGVTIPKIKEAMFKWLSHYYMANGRFRRSESGRPFIKCNDCGTRFIETHCIKTLDEWLEIMKKDHSLHKMLVSNQVLGTPELALSPLVLIQINSFKCGGMSVGLSWAHVLGDPFSASDYINMWGQVMAGHDQNPLPKITTNPLNNIEQSANLSPHAMDPLSLKRVDPVGDHWIPANKCKMETCSFHITGSQLSHLRSKIFSHDHIDQIQWFEPLCGIFWKSIAKISTGSDPKIVTVCKNKSRDQKTKRLSNSQIISVVKADFSILEANPKDLAALLIDQALEENHEIEQVVERDPGSSDFIVYGANLTFVDLEDATFYGLELNGQKPIFVNYTIDGIGENGVILVLPGPKNSGKDGSEGKIVTVILQENQVLELKSELQREWSIV